MILDWFAFNLENSKENWKYLSKFNLEPKSGEFQHGIRLGLGKPVLTLDFSSKALSEVNLEDIRELVLLKGFKVRRLDLALDDRKQFLNMDEIIKYLDLNSYTGLFNQYSRIISNKRIGSAKTKIRNFPGDTIYIGKRSSHTFLRIYDKAKESRIIKKYETLSNLKKRFKDLKKNPHWIRVELEFKQKNAQRIFEKLFFEDFFPQAYLLKFCDFKSLNSKSKYNFKKPTSGFWERFLEYIDKESLGLPKRHWSLETLEKWIEKQVSPSLYAFKEIRGENVFNNMIDKAKERYEKTIKPKL